MKKDICERTFKFAVAITKLCQKVLAKPGVGREIGKQLLRSGTSIGANAEEAQGAQSRADFVHKYSISRKEARETGYWLRLLVASEICAPSEVQELSDECDELLAILTSIIKRTKSRRESVKY